MVKRLSTMWETWVQSLGWEDPLEKEMAIHSSTIAWKIHGQRRLVGYSPWRCKESGTSERLHLIERERTQWNSSCWRVAAPMFLETRDFQASV